VISDINPQDGKDSTEFIYSTGCFQLSLGDLILQVPHNFGDRLTTKVVDEDFTHSLTVWLNETLSTASVGTDLGDTIPGLVMSCCMALESNWVQMQDYFKMKALMEAKPDAKADRSIFCEFMVLKNIAHGNFKMAEFFIKEMKKGLEQAMLKVFESGSDGDLDKQTIVRETLGVDDDGEFKSKVTKEESLGSGPYNEIMMYLKSKTEYADDLHNRLNNGWMLGADGLCYYDRMHYLHSVMLIAYAKWNTTIMDGVSDDTKMYNSLKESWKKTRNATDVEFEEAYPGITATLLEEGIYEMVPRFVNVNNSNNAKEFQDYIIKDKKWDKFLPIGCDMFCGRESTTLNFQMTWTDHSNFRTMMVNALNDINWDCPWSSYKVEVTNVTPVTGPITSN